MAEVVHVDSDEPDEVFADLPEHLREIGSIPHAGLYATEPLRGVIDAALLPLATPLLARAPHGDGHGVLVLPGLLASDGSTAPMRRYLRGRGYHVRGWRLGRNWGPSEEIMHGLPETLRDLAERTGGRVSVIGWSMGGIYARRLAHQRPELIRQVITMGSPYGVAHGHRTRVDATFDRLRAFHARPLRVPQRASIADPVPVPSTSFYSRYDGLVAWRACIDAETDTHQNIEVRCSHLGFGFDPATLWAVADRLAQPDGQWRAFSPPRGLGRLYRHVG